MPEQVKVEKWQTEAAQEIRTLKPNYTDARDYAEVIARHYAAREREVRELVTAAERMMAVVWNGADKGTDAMDSSVDLRTALAPFTAQGDGQ